MRTASLAAGLIAIILSTAAAVGRAESPAGPSPASPTESVEMQMAVIARQCKLAADQTPKVAAALAAGQVERAAWEKANGPRLANYVRLVNEAMQAVQSDVEKAPISDSTVQAAAFRRLGPMTAAPRDQVRPLAMQWIDMRKDGEAAVRSMLTPAQRAAWQGYVMWREATAFGMFHNVPLTAEQIEKCRPLCDAAAAKMAEAAPAGDADKARQAADDKLAADIRSQILTPDQRAAAERFDTTGAKIKDAIEGPCAGLSKECALTGVQQAAVRARVDMRDKALAEWQRTGGADLAAMRDAMVREWDQTDETAVNVLESDRQAILFDCYTAIILEVLTPEQRMAWRVYQGTLEMVMRLAPGLSATDDQVARVHEAMAAYYRQVASIQGTGIDAVQSRNDALRRTIAAARSILGVQ